ncbi:hypothetical protein ABT297_14260 [Dactylosporangium sp. NPDC000555]|uniref:hypothetical protein n=1 Tax=Dactylosporangium sp. NPDC000555 TaxID=3154260 RepID=UPI00331CB2AA
MSAERIEALLDAGAVLPVGTDAAKDTIDTLTTRAYGHPVLGDRKVVRLVPGTLGQAEDLTMEFLGFAAPETVAEVGVVRQQALGFPAWALVHDPANGHHALALVKDIERLVRVAKSRIGPARDGFNELGDRLARSVPHFLPTFYEEAARAFLAADSQTYAASMFGKAREAERLYALEIDEERQHAVFLEFALAGALTAKALAQHARDLAGRCTPQVAYERFRRLCVERTLGGMPPYAQMHVDLGRLAKAAGLGAEEDEALLSEVLAAPSILRAPGGFWKAYRPALVRLAGREPRVRGQLLGMFPGECPLGMWLDILEECGATAALTGPAGGVEASAESPDGPAGWLARADRSRGGWRRPREARLYAIAERMAPRLRADGVATDLAPSHQRIDLDLVDLALALGIPVAETAEDARCDVAGWISDDGEGRRDLTEVAAHERLLPLVAESMESYLKTWYRADQAAVAPDRVGRVVAVPGLRTALHRWLDRLADRIAAQGLTTLDDELDRLTMVACPAGLAVNPEAVARITALDLGPVLGRTLRAGVLDEFEWPALEAGAAAVRGDDRRPLHEDLTVVPQWPALVLHRGERVAVVGDEGLELEHTLRIPPDERRYSWRTAVRYVDGQLLVAWNRDGERAGYWSGAPDDVFTAAEDGLYDPGEESVALPGGGRSAGGRPLHPGDRRAQESGAVISDGQHYWVQTQDQSDHSWRWQEYDPATGARGRVSLPAFFEEGAVDGQPLAFAACRLRPASPRMALSPLGHRDGLVGWRVRHTPDGQTGEGVDGRSFALAEPEPGSRGRQVSLIGAIRFPGADAVHGLVTEHGWRVVTLHLHTADGLRFATFGAGGAPGPFAEGTPLVPPASFWHQLRPRDEAGSLALRGLGDERAAGLLATVSGLATAAGDRDELTFPDAELRAAVREAVPQLSAEALVAGVGGVVKHAARAALRLARLTSATEAVGAHDPQAVADGPDAHLAGDEVLDAALGGLIPHCYDHGREWVKLFADVGAALTGREPSAPLAPWLGSADLDWYSVLRVVPSIMLRAASPTTGEQHRAALLDLLEVLAGSGLLDGDGRTRRVTVESGTHRPQMTAGQIVTTGDGRRLLPFRVDAGGGGVIGIEHATDGRFGPVPGHTITYEQVYERSGDESAAVARFAAAGRARGGPADLLSPETVRAVSAAAGVSLAEATVVLAGTTDVQLWKAHRPADWQAADDAVTDYAIEAAIEHVQWLQQRRAGDGSAHTALLPAEPAELWTGRPDVARFAAWHAERAGARTPIGDDLIAALRRAGVPDGLSASEFLHGVTNPETCRWLHHPDAGVDGDDLLVTVVRGLPWLARHLPEDDPIRRNLPRVLELVRRLAADPAFEVPLDGTDEQNLEKILAALAMPVERSADRIDAGLFVVSTSGYWRRVHLRPARLDGPDDPRVDALVAGLGSRDLPVVALRTVLGDRLDVWLDTPFGDAPHDPSRSAPELVARVAERHGLGADAATLYLQLLALPDPTDRNVAAWTGWKPARLKAARAELLATDLVAEAKRPRAGRSLFLPGGWLAWKAPLPPVERWKLPLLIGADDDGAKLGAVIPVAPAPRLFELAWDRVVAGDHPRFEELTTRGRR